MRCGAEWHGASVPALAPVPGVSSSPSPGPLLQLIWTDQCCLDGELLIYGMAPLYGKKFIR